MLVASVVPLVVAACWILLGYALLTNRAGVLPIPARSADT